MIPAARRLLDLCSSNYPSANCCYSLYWQTVGQATDSAHTPTTLRLGALLDFHFLPDGYPSVSPLTPAADATLPLKGFKAYELDTFCNPVPSYNRLDFYKVSLVTGHIVMQYADRNLERNGTHLFFTNPHVPYSTLLSAKVTG